MPAATSAHVADSFEPVLRSVRRRSTMGIERDSFARRVLDGWRAVESAALTLADTSTIEPREEYVGVDVTVVAIGWPDFYWGPATTEHPRLQTIAKERFHSWSAQFELLLAHLPKKVQKEVADARAFVARWIEQEGDRGLPGTVAKAKEYFRSRTRVFLRIIESAVAEGAVCVVLVPDTNALIRQPELGTYRAVARKDEFTVVLVPTVLKELDKLKMTHRDPDFRKKVDSVITRIKGLRGQGNLTEGVTVHKTIKVKSVAKEPDFSHAFEWLDRGNDDDRLIASVLEVQRQQPGAVVVIVSADINLQNKAEAACLPYAEPPEGTSDSLNG
jgi:hypothetical protein